MSLDLAALLRLCDAATPGPWRCELDRMYPEDRMVSATVSDGEVRMLAVLDTDVGTESEAMESQAFKDAQYLSALDPATVRALVEMAQRGQAVEAARPNPEAPSWAEEND